jgi:large subunit ribosomal protein L18
MAKNIDRKRRRQRIHWRIRKTVAGTPERPRLVVFRSLSNVYVQAVDDVAGITVASASTVEKPLREGLKHTGNRQAAKLIGVTIAERLKEKGITNVVFDRAGFRYHGVVKELADAAREAGLTF